MLTFRTVLFLLVDGKHGRASVLCDNPYICFFGSYEETLNILRCKTLLHDKTFMVLRGLLELSTKGGKYIVHLDSLHSFESELDLLLEYAAK